MSKGLGILCAVSLLLAGCSGLVTNGANGNGGGTNTLGALNGPYAISLAGFDPTGNPVSIAGSIKADGLGHILSGEVDINDNGVISSSNTLSGIYAFDANIPLIGTYAFDNNGDGTLGTISLSVSVGAVAHPLSFAFSLQASGGFGEIMSLDTNNFIASGTMQLQSPSAFTLASLAGDYAVQLDGRIAASPASALGRFTLASGGAASSVTFDRSIAGVGSAGPTTGASATIAFDPVGPDINGRGGFTLTLNDALATSTENFAYYTISTKKIIAVETGGDGTMTANLSRQSTPFAASTVTTPGSVFAISGVDTAATGNEIAAVGQMQISAVGANTGTLLWDSNDAGIVVGPASFANQAVPAFDTATGRGTVSIADGAANGLADSMVFYLTAPGTGFLMDTTTGVFNRAMVGTLSPQAGAPYTTASVFVGLGIVRTKGSSVNNALSFAGLFGLTTTPASYGFTFDQRFPKNGATQTQIDQSAAGIKVQTLDQFTGRGTMSLPNGTKTGTEAYYVVGPNQFVFIDVSPVSSGLNGPSNLFFVDAH